MSRVILYKNTGKRTVNEKTMKNCHAWHERLRKEVTVAKNRLCAGIGWPR